MHSKTSDSHDSRTLPNWVRICSDEPGATSTDISKKVPDGVHNYACPLLNDGILILELRDAIHEGDGEHVLACWKLMLLYFRYAKHYKYSLEAFHLTAAVNGINSTRLSEEIKYNRFIIKKYHHKHQKHCI